MRVVINPGHGGKFPGAVANGLTESHVNLAVSQLVAKILVDEGHVAILTRTGDTHFKEDVGSDLAAICAFERVNNADVFLSIHCNAAAATTARGVEVFTTPGETRADPLATCVFDAIRSSFPLVNYRTDFSDGDPDKEARLYVLLNTAAPAILVELAFLSNAFDAEWIGNQNTQVLMAMAIAAGLLAWHKGESHG
jgi:N-acetylmuramoyl-L-alanine amidase